MKKLSGFDLGMIIAFSVVTLLGGGAWYYLSGQLDAAKQEVTVAQGEFDKYSNKQIFLPTEQNENVLQENIDLMKDQLDPLIESKLQGKDNKLASITKEDTVAWKHDLDEEVRHLTAAAKTQNVTLPSKFYYGFSHYLNQNPGDEQTLVLNKQLLGIEQMATILINAPVKGIQGIKRTFEEEPHGAPAAPGAPPSPPPLPGQNEADRLPGYSLQAPGGIYTAYPFEISFDATTQNLRKVLDDLIKSPYVFVVRSLAVQNDKTHSPQIAALDQMVVAPPSVTDSSPGAVAATTSTQGPRFLFGDEILHVKMRVDMIEWNPEAIAEPVLPPSAHGTRHKPSGTSPGTSTPPGTSLPETPAPHGGKSEGGKEGGKESGKSETSSPREGK